jgi:ATP-dependent RNA helicase DDX56/DBP9
LYFVISDTYILGSDDVEKLKKLILHNSYILTLPEVGDITDEVIPKNVEQSWVRILII